jgi:hypothetical protein
MKSLEDLERSLLQAARRGLGPPNAAQARVRSAALSAIAANVDVPLPEPSAFERLAHGAQDALDALRSTRTQANILVGVLGISGVGATGYALGLHAGRTEKQVQGGTSAASAPHGQAAIPVTGQVVEAEPVAGVPARRPTGVHNPQPSERAVPSAPAVTPATDLDEELRTLRRIERVLRENNPRLALSLLDDLDRSTPHGKLLEERDAARVVALCSLDDAASVSNGRAAEFATRQPGSVYTTRVNRACAVDEPERERIQTPVETDLHK